MTAKAVAAALALLALSAGSLYLADRLGLDQGTVVCGVRDFPPSCASTR